MNAQCNLQVLKFMYCLRIIFLRFEVDCGATTTIAVSILTSSNAATTTTITATVAASTTTTMQRVSLNGSTVDTDITSVTTYPRSTRILQTTARTKSMASSITTSIPGDESGILHSDQRLSSCPVPPSLLHGSVTTSSLAIGSVVTYQCGAPYELSGSPTAICLLKGRQLAWSDGRECIMSRWIGQFPFPKKLSKKPYSCLLDFFTALMELLG